MKIVITGGNGQLGREIQEILSAGQTGLGAVPRAEVTAVDMDTLDITNLEETTGFLTAACPDVVINCAAYTNVDACETDQDLAFRVNALGPRNLAIAAEMAGSKLVHISTDYVFPGTGAVPYREWDACGPQSVYGYTKYLGEQYVRDFSNRYFIVRTAWLYGRYGNNFVKTILKNGKDKGALRVVDDQRGNPTNAEELAHHLVKLAMTDEYGVYHCTGNGECSWFDFACEIIRLGGVDCTVSPCATADFPRPAKRPAYSSLDNLMLRNTVGDGMRDWKDSLASFMKRYDEESGEMIR